MKIVKIMDGVQTVGWGIIYKENTPLGEGVQTVGRGNISKNNEDLGKAFRLWEGEHFQKREIFFKREAH